MSNKVTTPPPAENEEMGLAQVESGLSFGNFDGSKFSDLSKKKAGSVDLRMGNLKFEVEGESYRLVFVRMTIVPSTDVSTGEIKIDPETGLTLMQDAVIFYNPETKGMLLARQTVVVSICRESKMGECVDQSGKLYYEPVAVEVTYKGDAKSKKGMTYQDFSVFPLED